jgi:hypothetical protein
MSLCYTRRFRLFRNFGLGILGLSLICTSCKDGSDEDGSDENLSELTELTDYLQSDDFAYEQICAVLFDAEDSLHTTPTIGAALDVTLPTVYTAGADSLGTATLYFSQMCRNVARRDTLSDGSIDYNVGKYGTVCYHPYGADDALASIDINLHPVSSITQLQFIPKDLWPDNDVSSIAYGDIVQEIATGRKWVCVQELGAGLPALFVTFGISLHVAAGGYSNHIEFSSCATYEALSAFVTLVKSGHELYADIGRSKLSKIASNILDVRNLVYGQSNSSRYSNCDVILFYTGMRVEMVTQFSRLGAWTSDVTQLRYVNRRMYVEMESPVTYSVIPIYDRRGRNFIGKDATFDCYVEIREYYHLGALTVFDPNYGPIHYNENSIYELQKRFNEVLDYPLYYSYSDSKLVDVLLRYVAPYTVYSISNESQSRSCSSEKMINKYFTKVNIE